MSEEENGEDFVSGFFDDDGKKFNPFLFGSA